MRSLGLARVVALQDSQQAAQVQIRSEFVKQLGVVLDPLVLGDHRRMLAEQVGAESDGVERVHEHGGSVVGAQSVGMVFHVFILWTNTEEMQQRLGDGNSILAPTAWTGIIRETYAEYARRKG